jgi:hypothetical protein
MKRLRQAPRLSRRFGGAGSGMGAHGERSIPEQTHPSEHHPGDLNLEHSLDERVLSHQDHPGEIIGQGHLGFAPQLIDMSALQPSRSD